MAWSIRNYNTFLRKARQQYALTMPQARSMYTRLSKHLGKPLTGTILEKHPRLSSRFVEQSSRLKRTGLIASFAAGGVSEIGVPGGGTVDSAGGRGGGGSLDDWEDFIDDFDYNYDYYEYDGSVDYGEE